MYKRTKIIATLGPATDDDATLSAMLAAGCDVVRINCSHGDEQSRAKRIDQVRRLRAAGGFDTAIMADLQGPKIRIDAFTEHEIELNSGDSFALDSALDPHAGTQEVVGVAYDALADDVEIGDRLLLNDGAIVLRVLEVRATRVHCEVEVGGRLSDHKGLNIQGGGLSASALSDKDLADIEQVAAEDVDYLAVSFVRSADDIEAAREHLRRAGSEAGIIAKIERAEAIDNLEAIIEASDGVMVARGDLGVEMGYAELIGLQKRILRMAHAQHKVTIIATQMMESMIEQAMPTRAEVADVSNAVLDGTDAVMLSAETAVGAYPLATVQAMAAICAAAERFENAPSAPAPDHYELVDQAIAGAVGFTAARLGASAIVALTESGATARWLSRTRSPIPIFALTRHERTRRAVSLYRGVAGKAFDVMGLQAPGLYQEVFDHLINAGEIADGDLLIITKGDQKGIAGGTNAMKILKATASGG